MMPALKTSRKCAIAGCDDAHHSKGWCAHHYQINWRHGTPTKLGVKRRTRSCGHFASGAVCSIAGCQNPMLAKGFCRKHYARQRTHGDPAILLRRPKGQGSIARGYVRRTVGDPGERRTVLAHREIMEKSLGRPLTPKETVHHKNGVRSDNRLVKGHELHCPSTCCNLELWSTSHPYGQRVSDKLAWAKEILAKYGEHEGS